MRSWRTGRRNASTASRARRSVRAACAVRRPSLQETSDGSRLSKESRTPSSTTLGSRKLDSTLPGPPQGPRSPTRPRPCSLAREPDGPFATAPKWAVKILQQILGGWECRPPAPCIRRVVYCTALLKQEAVQAIQNSRMGGRTEGISEDTARGCSTLLRLRWPGCAYWQLPICGTGWTVVCITLASPLGSRGAHLPFQSLILPREKKPEHRPLACVKDDRETGFRRNEILQKATTAVPSTLPVVPRVVTKTYSLYSWRNSSLPSLAFLSSLPFCR